MKMFVRVGVLSAFALASVVVAARGQAAQEQAQKKEPPVYDEAADARAQVAKAVAHAKKDNKRVLIQWGANWCGWCVLLHGTMKSDKDVAKKLLYEYDVVRIDVGRLDKNIDFAKELGAEFEGIPFITVLDADGKALVQQSTEVFEITGEKQGHDPRKLVEFLTKWQATPLVAADVRAAALARAKAEKKLVLMHTGAPWCGWCHKLEAWLAQPEVAALLAKDFVDLKIDNDRMTGAKELLAAEYQRAQLKDQGFPWLVVLDADGAQLANGTRPEPDGNIGFPYKDEEIAFFVTMLSKVKRNLTDADLTTLRDSLTAVRKADEAKKIQQ